MNIHTLSRCGISDIARIHRQACALIIHQNHVRVLLLVTVFVFEAAQRQYLQTCMHARIDVATILLTPSKLMTQMACDGSPLSSSCFASTCADKALRLDCVKIRVPMTAQYRHKSPRHPRRPSASMTPRKRESFGLMSKHASTLRISPNLSFAKTDWRNSRTA